jgi:hypothetical protein
MSGEDDGLRRFALDARARLKPLDVWLSESPRTPSDVRAYFVFAAEIEAILAGERPARLADRHGNTASYGCAARMTASAFRRGVSEGVGVSKVDGQ